MSRIEMIQALQELGFPVDTINDAVPDELLVAILQIVEHGAPPTAPAKLNDQADIRTDDDLDDDEAQQLGQHFRENAAQYARLSIDRKKFAASFVNAKKMAARSGDRMTVASFIGKKK